MNSTLQLSKLYILSPLYELPEAATIINFEEVNEAELPELNALKNKELFILTNERGSRYLINPTIKIFLEAFQKPTHIEDVIASFAEKTNATVEQINDIMHTFLKGMLSKGILVESEIAEEIIEKQENEFFVFKELEAGEKIGQYEVISLLATHGPTQVYICKSENVEETLVVKTIFYPEELPDIIKQESIEKFKQEFELMNELKGHPNVCELIQFDTCGEVPYAAIEHVKGQSLRAYIQEVETSMDDKLNIIQQFIEAIAFVQSKNIIHGDIHLSNFLVRDDKRVKLIDFGYSNHQNLMDNEIIRNGGVHECIPPERIDEDAFGFLSQRGNYASEVFQLGVLIHYVLYQQYPFKGFTWKALAHSIKEDIVELEQRTFDNQRIPEKIILVLKKALQKQPSNRFNNAQAMLDFLK